MISFKKPLLLLILFSLLLPLSSYSSRRKVKEDDEAALQRQQELMEKRAKAEADIEARKRQAEDDELAAKQYEEQLEKERLEAERLEAERIAKEKAEAERLEAERIEAQKREEARLEEEKQALLTQQMQLALEKEKQKAAEAKKTKEYLSDYMIQDIEEIDESTDSQLSEIKNPDEADFSNVTLLMKAAKMGNEWQIKRLLEAGANTNLKDNEGWTALMYAVRYNEGLESVELLLNAGADIKLSNNYGLTAVTLAASYNNNPKILLRLLKDYNPSDREVLRSLVMLLSEQNITEDVQLSKLDILLDTALPLNILYDGKTPLMYAAAYGKSTKIIQKLLDYNSSATMRSTEGKTAFDYASNNKNLAHDETYWALNVK